MRIIFMGTPDFAAASLEKILEGGHDVAAVFTQPDRPKGRGYRLTPPPVKETALNHEIKVHQPLTLKDDETVELIKNYKPECIVVVAYGLILPERVLEVPPLGCINVHASLLPKLRGAAPIQWSIINGEKETGVTTMYMAKGLDTGDMILKSRLDIGPDETFGELHDRLMKIGAETLLKTLTLLEQGKAPREKQDDVLSNYAPMIDKTNSMIDWSKSAQDIHNLVRGLNPFPAAYTLLGGEKFKIISSKLTSGAATDKVPGTVVSSDDSGFLIACGDGRALLVKDVQAQGGKRMTAAAYAHGHGINEKTIFGR
ncbi:MAG TPA: methionyl-tRNA formyltransferase [Ruminiclostridium sp.]|nr:methionyl-tRNA formyltransferase [Ruminiclostridium sp.]